MFKMEHSVLDCLADEAEGNDNIWGLLSSHRVGGFSARLADLSLSRLLNGVCFSLSTAFVWAFLKAISFLTLFSHVFRKKKLVERLQPAKCIVPTGLCNRFTIASNSTTFICEG